MPETYKKFENAIYHNDILNPNPSNSEKDYLLKMGSLSITNKILENKNYSFGLEIETSSGKLNEYSHLNLNCTYDDF